MAKKRGVKTAGRPGTQSRWGLLAVAGIVVLALAGGGLWLWLGNPAGGTPRLAVDRADVDLGYLRFEAPARVVFTLTNSGDAPLRLAGAPRVKAVAGC